MLAKNLKQIEKLLQDHCMVYYSQFLLPMAEDLYIVPTNKYPKEIDKGNFKKCVTELYQSISPFKDLVFAIWKDSEGELFGNAAYVFKDLQNAVEIAQKIGHKYLYVNDQKMYIA